MGNMQDMNNRIKQNRDQRPSQRPKFKGSNRAAIYSTEVKPERPTFKKLSETELKLVSRRIREAASKDLKRNQVVYAYFIVIAIFLSLALLLWLNE